MRGFNRAEWYNRLVDYAGYWNECVRDLKVADFGLAKEVAMANPAIVRNVKELTTDADLCWQIIDKWGGNYMAHFDKSLSSNAPLLDFAVRRGLYDSEYLKGVRLTPKQAACTYFNFTRKDWPYLSSTFTPSKSERTTMRIMTDHYPMQDATTEQDAFQLCVSEYDRYSGQHMRARMAVACAYGDATGTARDLAKFLPNCFKYLPKKVRHNDQFALEYILSYPHDAGNVVEHSTAAPGDIARVIGDDPKVMVSAVGSIMEEWQTQKTTNIFKALASDVKNIALAPELYTHATPAIKSDVELANQIAETECISVVVKESKVPLPDYTEIAKRYLKYRGGNFDHVQPRIQTDAEFLSWVINNTVTRDSSMFHTDAILQVLRDNLTLVQALTVEEFRMEMLFKSSGLRLSSNIVVMMAFVKMWPSLILCATDSARSSVGLHVAAIEAGGYQCFDMFRASVRNNARVQEAVRVAREARKH
jgi:hypothetical protein